MRLKEQKLIFTRNGEYTLWEKLTFLSDSSLREIYKFTAEKLWVNEMPDAIDLFPSFLFRLWTKLELTEDKEELVQYIEQEFAKIEEPKFDFNGYIYHYPGTSLDLKSAELNLQALKNDANEFEIDGLTIDYFLYDTINDIHNVVDVRFSSEKTSGFQEAEISQIINTEIRVYLDLNIALCTNYSEYTHTDSNKRNFVKAIIKRVSTSGDAIEPISISDQSLRNLLVISENIPSKFKFEVEGITEVGVKIKETVDLKELVNRAELKNLFENYMLTMIKVKLSDDEDKTLVVNGAEGKITCKSHSLEVCDVDQFIVKLSELFKYDYLNSTYIKEIEMLASKNLLGTRYEKIDKVRKCYKQIEDEIKTVLSGETLLLKIIVHALDQSLSIILGQIAGQSSKNINSLFNFLIELAIEKGPKVGDFIVSLDSIIHSKKGITNASGF